MTPDPLQCLTCGAVVIGGTRFCGQCGADFRKPPPAAAAPKTAPRKEWGWKVIAYGAAALYALACLGALVFRSPDDGGTVTVRACYTCRGTGKVTVGAGDWTQTRTCRVCGGAGANEVR